MICALYCYYQIGLLVTVFMAGTAVSSLLATRRLGRWSSSASAFLVSELCLVAFASLLPLALTVPSRYLTKPAVNLLLHVVFPLLSFTSGALSGLQFPLAARLHLGRASISQVHQRRRRGAGRTSEVAEGKEAARDETARTAGLLYGADPFGGYFGGLIGGVILLPILGLRNTCFILAMIKASSLLLNLLHKRIAGKGRSRI